MQNRRSFLKVLAGASALFPVPSPAAHGRWHRDWLAAFRTTGFDPTQPGSSVFVVCGDVHEPEYSQHLPAQIEAWNAMRPAPRFVTLLGDNVCSVSRSFGQTPDAAGLARARVEMESLRTTLAMLRRDIPLKLVIGNHDTFPGEIDAAFFRETFPEVKPYEAFDESGIHFMIWNGGHDGALDPRQREWIRNQSTALPQGRTAVILVHQPSLGMTVRERGIPAAVRKYFTNTTGPLWLLAGHVHSNSLKVFALPKTRIVQATHVKSIDGYWIYGMRKGRVAARAYRSMQEGFRVESLPDPTRTAPPLPLPFEERDDVLWSLLIGDDKAATRASFVSGTGGNCGTWWFYVNELVFRLPLAQRASGATHFAVLATLSKHRKTGEPAHIFASGDGVAWEETPLLETRASLNRFAIPAALQGARDLHVKVQSHGYGADTCVGGFALCR